MVEIIDDQDFMRELARRVTAFITRHPREAHTLLMETGMTLQHEVAESFKPFTKRDEIQVNLASLLSMMTQMPNGVCLGVRVDSEGKIRGLEAAYPDDKTMEVVWEMMGGKKHKDDPD